MHRLMILAWFAACAPPPRAPAPAPVPPPTPTVAPSEPAALFGSHEIIELELAGPLRDAWRERKKDERDSFDATLSFPHEGGVRTVPVRLQAKGRTRAEQCEVPPYKLKVDPSLVTGTLLAGQSVMRVVSHCRDDPRYEQRAVEEYLAYRLLNLLTDWSLRARLVRMTYRDTERDETETYFAVFTEQEEQLAARTGWHKVRVDAVPRAATEPNQAALVGLFNFLIGNTDFSVLRGPPGERCCHNVELIGTDEGPFIPVPFDFDSAGLIDAPYAEPSPELPIRSVRERYYWGLCRHNNYVPQLLTLLTAMRPRIESLYREQEGLDPERLEYALEYLGEFFELAADPEAVEEQILGRCR